MLRRAGLVTSWRAGRRVLYQRTPLATSVIAASGGTAPRREAQLAKQMKPVQSVFGDHQDTVIARPVERELGISARLDGENAFSYGLLYGRDACDAARLQAQGWKTWRRASRPRYRRWMH